MLRHKKPACTPWSRFAGNTLQLWSCLSLFVLPGCLKNSSSADSVFPRGWWCLVACSLWLKESEPWGFVGEGWLGHPPSHCTLATGCTSKELFLPVLPF